MRSCLELPFPISVNGMFANRKGGRRKTDKYLMWLADAHQALLQQQEDVHKHLGRVNVILLLGAPDNRRRDGDNALKGILDFLVTHKIIVDDDSRYVRSITVQWRDNMDAGCIVMVTDI